MRIVDVVPLFSILWKASLGRAQSGTLIYEQFSCYRCESLSDESCNTIDRTCSYPLCAKIKYKDDNIIKIIRECSPSADAIAGKICSQAEQLRGKPCDAWLCDTPMCNGAGRLSNSPSASCALQNLMWTLIMLSYFLLYG